MKMKGYLKYIYEKIMSRKKLVEIFEKLNATDTEEIIKMSLGETLDMWKVILEWNENKYIPAKIDIDLGNLIHFYVVKYTCFSFSVNNKNICKETLLYSSLFAVITNTVFTIWKLASDGLDYSAKILLRNLLELILTTLTILLDKEKRIVLMEFDLNKTDEVWYKHFSIKKMLSTISKCK